MIKVFLAEDQNIVSDGIKMLLAADEQIQVVGGMASSSNLLAELSAGKEIDVVLTDINGPGADGIALIKQLKALNPKIAVVIFSMQDKEEYILQAFAEGADGYLLKSVSAQEMLFCIKLVNDGNKYLCTKLTSKIIDRLAQSKKHLLDIGPATVDFSLREIEVLNLIAEGYTNNEMSEKLFLSKRTIEGHRQSLIDKTKSRNTAALIRFAVLHGIVK